jgi:DNA-binding PadR family transcriptional regulator
MHPYEMQRLIREWHKDEFLDLKRGSLYHAIERLQLAGLIEPVETTREGRRPERTVYRLTESGDREGLDWLRDLLAKPAREASQFLAAISYLPCLTPEDAVDQLETRVGRIDLEILTLSTVLQTMVPQIGRIPLLEVEYVRAMLQAEKEWVRSVIEEVRAGKLTWNPEVLRGLAQQQPGGEGSPGCG